LWAVALRNNSDTLLDVGFAYRHHGGFNERGSGEVNMIIPTKPGYYWAKWIIAADDTHEGSELTPAQTWEIVQVNINQVNWRDNPLALSVSVPGVREDQWRDCFVWGDFVAELRS
jgi:hypothetical protein